MAKIKNPSQPCLQWHITITLPDATTITPVGVAGINSCVA